MIRVLQELSALDGGGVAKLVFDYYSNMDKSKIHFDFLIYDFYENGIYEQPLKDLGCTIYKLPSFKKDKKGYLREMKKVIKNGNYDVVHSHMGSRGLFVMRFAKKYKVKKRIVHSHIAFEPVSTAKKYFNKGLSIVAKHYATDLFACGKDAGIYMWGKKATVHIMTNAVDTEKFQFSSETRIQKREELGIQDKFVIGIVGRLSSQKNYPYLFKVYKKVLETRDDVALLVVGRGLEEEAIINLSKEMGVFEKTLFLGVRNDVPELLNAFDVFVLPSLYEGLPVVLIEAQANGLPEIVSSKITTEMDITDLISFKDINENSVDDWVNAISNYKTNVEKRKEYSKIMKTNNYDIVTQSGQMQSFYLD